MVLLLSLLACTRAPCGVSAEPRELSWAETPAGSSDVLPVALSNSCDAAETVELRIDGDPAFTISATTAEVPAEGSVAVEVRFAPPDAVVRRADLLAGDETIALQGAGIGSGDTDPDTDDEDADGDGYSAPEDCDDADDTVFPGAPESEDGLDDDCDGLVDEDFARPGEVLVSEAMIDPVSVADATGQWLEITVLGGRTVDLRGWRIASGAGAWTVPSSVVLAPGDRVVFAASGDSSANGGVTPREIYGSSLALGGQIVLNRQDGLEIDRLAFSGWDLPSGASLSLAPGREGEADDEIAWCDGLSVMSGGDRGTPGAPNDDCSPDADGDGYSLAEGDCDDADARAHPGGTEIWGDLVDDDCDGMADEGDVTVAAGTLDGSTRSTPDYLGYRSNFGVGDLDGDGKSELIAGSWYGYDDEGVVYVVDGASFATWSGAASSKAQATIHGIATQQRLGAVATSAADASGDGEADLVVAGHDGYGGHAVVLFAGPITGTLTDSNGRLTMSGSQSSDHADVHGGLDLDGDGVAEIVYGEGRAHVTGTWEYDGRVSVLVSEGKTGDVAVDDADVVWRGDADYDYLGETVGGGDLDGDGRDDLVLGAWGQDGSATSGGALYVMRGSASLWPGGLVGSDADAVIEGHVANRRVGSGAEPVVRDLDGDGSVDLAIGAWENRTAYVFLDAGSLAGTVTTASADVAITGDVAPDDLSLGLCAGDFDGDGRVELAAGAPDDEQKLPSAATTLGQVYLFAVGDLSGSGGTSDALATIGGAAVGDGFGQSLGCGDLDNDGDDELIVDAPGYGSGVGRLYVVDF